MTDVLIPAIAAALTLVAGFMTWYLNERSKRLHEDYKRKEQRYAELIRSLKGFYVDSFSRDLRSEFLNQLNLCWMYCPDDVIKKAYRFLLMVHIGSRYSDDEKEKAAGDFILAIRRDLLGRRPLRRTELTPEDFKHLKAA